MGAGKRYSAGAIFLQVVPVFANVQRAIEDEAKGWERSLGDEMEKAGDKAGQRAGKAAAESMDKELKKGSESYAGHFETRVKGMVKNAQRELDRLDLSTASEKMISDLEKAKATLKSLNEQDFNLEFDAKKVLRDVAEVKAAVEAITKHPQELNIDSNFRQVLRDIAKIETAYDKALRDRHMIVDVDTSPAERKMSAFEREFKKVAEKAASHLSGSINPEVTKIEKELDRLKDVRIGVDLSANRARFEITALAKRLDALRKESPDIDIKVDTARAFAEIFALEKALKKIDGQNVNIDTSGATRGLFGLKRSGDDAANSFRSFNIVWLAVAGMGPALVPVLAAVAGGLLALAPAAAAAGAGLAGVLIGFSGLGDALTALQAREKQQAMTAQTAGKRNQTAGYAVKDALQGVADAERSAAQAAQDAAQRVADAKRQAADAIRNALEQQESAQRSYAQSVRDVQEAEQNLREARAEAAGTGHTLKDKIKDNALAITQAQLNSADATNTYNAVMADGSSTNTEQIQAKLNRDEALQALHELRDQQKELAKEKKKWDKEGVDGTDAVQSAQDALTSAIQQQQDAYRSLQDAARQVDEARAAGARDVKRAIEAQNQTLADNARNIARADEALRRARENQGKTFDQLNSQQAAVDAAFANLGPAGRKFALFLFGLQKDFQKWRRKVQAAMLPSIQTAIEGFIGSKSAGFLSDWIINMARGFGQWTKALSRSFQGPVWTQFFKTMADVGPRLQKAYGHAFIKVMEAFASILTTLAPFALRFAKGLDRMATAFANWAKSKDGTSTVQRFLAYVHKIGPRVLELFEAFGGAVLNLLIALAPYGDIVLTILTGILNYIAKMDPKTLGAIASGILAVVTASQIAYAAMNFLKAGTALLTSSFGLFIFFLVGAALAVVYLYKKNKALGIAVGILAGLIFGAVAAYKAWVLWQKLVVFWQGVQNSNMLIFAARYYAVIAAQKLWAAMTRIATAVQWAWNAAMEANPIGLIVIALVAVVAGMIWAYKHFKWFHDAVDAIIHGIVGFFQWLWDVLFGHSIMPDIVDGMHWAADMIGKAFDLIGDFIHICAKVFQWLWDSVVKPVAHFIGKAFSVTFHAIKTVWTKVLGPVLKVIGKIVWTLWKVYVKVALTLIKAYFKTVFWAIKTVWNHVLHPVFTAISKVLNWLWDKVFKPVLGWIGDRFADEFRGMKLVWDKVLHPVFDYIADKALPKLKSAFDTAVSAIKKIWDGLKKVVGAPIKFVLDTIINKGLIAGFNKVAGWVHMDGFNEIPIPKSLQSYATGGIMPGYTPGRDPHKFYSPTGGRLELSGGEAVMRPEWTAAMGSGYVNQMNAIARQGGVNAVRKAMGFATGGIMSFARGGILNPDDKVYINGMAISRVAAAQVALAKQMSGIPIYMMQGGFGGNHVAASGTSHNYPGVGDFGPGSIALEKVMRQVGFAAWARNVAGRSSVGSGAHVHAVSLLDPMDRNSPQVYGSWANHGNGLSGYNNDPAPHYSWIPGLISKIASMGIGQIASLIGADGEGGSHRSIPGFIKDVLLHPIDTIKGWVSGTWGKASELVTQSPIFDVVKHVPEALADGFKGKVWDIMPGWVKDTVGVAQKVGGAIKEGVGDVVHGAGDVVSGAGHLVGIGMANGGVLPYNGTMMYDNGGYLPPGLTTVVNLTGKPEPVFTADQWSGVGDGRGGNIHYEPHFEGSNLTAEDVASDLNFTFRRIRRGGKYVGVGAQ